MKLITIAAAIAIAVLPLSGALAQQQLRLPLGQQATSPAQKDKDSKRAAKACPEYGEGFVRGEGTSSCIKVGGYVRYETSRSR
jgi:hypothetical protein